MLRARSEARKLQRAEPNSLPQICPSISPLDPSQDWRFIFLDPTGASNFPKDLRHPFHTTPITHPKAPAKMSDAQPQDAASRQKTPKAQLSKGMEHMRFAVTIPDTPPTSAPSTPPVDSAADSLSQTTDTTSTNTSTPSEENAYGVPATFQPLRKPATDSASNPQKRTDPFQFGSRYLEEGDDIFAYNAWDHVETDSAYKAFIETQTAVQRSSPVSDFDKKRFNGAPEKWWDKFYSNNQANFFKDRKWLVQEFPVLGEVTKECAGRVKILEIGAGAGNTAFPIMAMNRNPELTIHACDYSKKAVEIIRAQEAYDGKTIVADVWDAAGKGEGSAPPGIEKGSVDIVIMIFIFSALAPDQWKQCVRNVWELLKPGGLLLFRDYGRGDLAQVRFKKGRYLDENFYVRGDGTRVYFFEEDELRQIWTGQLEATRQENGKTVAEEAKGEDIDAELSETLKKASIGQDQEAWPQFDVLNLGVDRRMLVNRQRKLKMYRCWMQGRFQKPATAAP